MNIFYGKSSTGSLAEALNGLTAPKLIILLSCEEKFEVNVETLERLYPGIPSIGCTLMSYGSEIVENGASVIAFTGGVSIATGVLEKTKTAPARFIKRLIDDVEALSPGNDDTALINFCTGGDKKMLNTISYEVESKGIHSIGAGTNKSLVSANGVIYEEATVYAVIKNLSGKIKSYSESSDVAETEQVSQIMEKIHLEFPSFPSVLAINNFSRYQTFKENGELDSYLKKLEMLGDLCGIVGYGVHFKDKYLKGAMSCIVFE